MSEELENENTADTRGKRTFPAPCRFSFAEIDIVP